MLWIGLNVMLVALDSGLAGAHFAMGNWRLGLLYIACSVPWAAIVLLHAADVGARRQQ